MKTTINSQTGLAEVNFTAKLLSFSEKSLESKTNEGVFYKPCSIEFTDAKGVKQTTSAIMYDNNFKYGVEKGKSYLATAIKTEQGVLIKVSHLEQINAERPNEDMFGFNTSTNIASNKALVDAKF